VYIARDDELQIVPVDILWRTENAVFVRGSLAAGDRVIVSPLRTAIAGMAVRVVEGQPAKP
jgi:hypothetical protein